VKICDVLCSVIICVCSVTATMPVELINHPNGNSTKHSMSKKHSFPQIYFASLAIDKGLFSKYGPLRSA